MLLSLGDEALFQAASGPLDVMGKAKFFLGPEGQGANMKLVVNAVMGAMMASFAEGMSLADQVGDLTTACNPWDGVGFPKAEISAEPGSAPASAASSDWRLPNPKPISPSCKPCAPHRVPRNMGS